MLKPTISEARPTGTGGQAVEVLRQAQQNYLAGFMPITIGNRPEISGLYFTSSSPEPSEAGNGSSDLSQGQVNRKPRSKG